MSVAWFLGRPVRDERVSRHSPRRVRQKNVAVMPVSIGGGR